MAAIYQLKKETKYTEAHPHIDYQLEAAINGWKQTKDFSNSLKYNKSIEKVLGHIVDAVAEGLSERKAGKEKVAEAKAETKKEVKK